jgi:hypothetical protein
VSTVVLAVITAALAAAVGAGATAVWLFARYRPSADGVDPVLLNEAARSTATWSDVHQGALVVLLGLLVLALVAGPVAVAEEGRGPGRPLAAGLVAVVGGAAAAVGALTSGPVAWDQVALDEVTVGTELGGWRLAALDDRVRFVLVDGAEVSQGTYAGVLAVHLVAPVVAVVALVVLALLVRAARRRAAVLAHAAMCL